MDLMKLLPDYYKNNFTMEELQKILSLEINNLDLGLNETIDQCFINTSTKLLSRHENVYGIEVDTNKTDEFRRERIRAKIRGVGTVTKEMIRDVAASYSNGEVEVFEDNSNYHFTIKFVGTLGLPGNMADLIITIEEIKPAHLAYTFEYVYRTHSEIKGYRHSGLSTFTHLELREGVI